MANAKRVKKGSNEIDKLIAEVDRLHAGGMSVNKACAKVGLQNTVYYFRKRKDAAVGLLPAASLKSTVSVDIYDHKDFEELKKEARELEARLNSIKLALANKMLSKET